MLSDDLTIERAASYTGYSVSYLYNLRCDDRGPRSYRRHGRLWYRRRDLDDFLEKGIRESTRGGVLV